MSDRFDENQHEEAAVAARPQSRSRALLITGLVLVLAFFALTTFSSIYTDRLWYRAEGYGEVFSKLFWTRTGLFLVFGLLMAVAVGANMYLAHRFRPFFRPDSPEQAGPRALSRRRAARARLAARGCLGRHRPLRRHRGGGGVAHLPAVGQPHVPSSRADRFFRQDIGFYVFELPWLHYLVNFAMAAAGHLAAGGRHRALPVRRHPAADARRPADRRRAGAVLGAARPVRAGQGRRLLARPLRPGQRLGQPDRRHHLHRRPCRAAGQEHPARHRGDLRRACSSSTSGDAPGRCPRSVSPCSCCRPSCSG